MPKVMLVAILLMPLAVRAQGPVVEERNPVEVEVVNFPDPQNVIGTVDVGNLPSVQQITGQVNVGNLPLDDSGSLRITCAPSASSTQVFPDVLGGLLLTAGVVVWNALGNDPVAQPGAVADGEAQPKAAKAGEYSRYIISACPWGFPYQPFICWNPVLLSWPPLDT